MPDNLFLGDEKIVKNHDVRNPWTNEILTRVYSATCLLSSEIVHTLTIKDRLTLGTQPNHTETQQFHQKNKDFHQ